MGTGSPKFAMAGPGFVKTVGHVGSGRPVSSTDTVLVYQYLTTMGSL